MAGRSAATTPPADFQWQAGLELRLRQEIFNCRQVWSSDPFWQENFNGRQVYSYDPARRFSMAGRSGAPTPAGDFQWKLGLELRPWQEIFNGRQVSRPRQEISNGRQVSSPDGLRLVESGEHFDRKSL